MANQIKIDTRFLTRKIAKKFSRKDGSVFTRAYNSVLANLVDRSCLPYLPTLYIFPYVLIDQIPISDRKAISYVTFAMQSIDPSDLEKLAIFAPIYLKRLSFEEINYCLAHEISHFVQRRGSVDVALIDLVPTLKMGRLETKRTIEKAARDTYNIFKEPFRSELIRSDRELARNSMRARENKERLIEEAKVMKHHDFIKYILGDKYQEFRKIIGEKIKKKGILS